MRARTPEEHDLAVFRLNSFLDSVVKEGRAPAIFAGVTGIEGELYFGASGPRYHGYPERGFVDENTSE